MGAVIVVLVTTVGVAYMVTGRFQEAQRRAVCRRRIEAACGVPWARAQIEALCQQ